MLTEICLLSLPDLVVWGQSDQQFNSSMLVTAPLRKLFHSQDPAYPYEALTDQMSAKAEIRHEIRKQADLNAKRLRDVLTPTLQEAMDLEERGSSS